MNMCGDIDGSGGQKIVEGLYFKYVKMYSPVKFFKKKTKERKKERKRSSTHVHVHGPCLPSKAADNMHAWMTRECVMRRRHLESVIKCKNVREVS